MIRVIESSNVDLIVPYPIREAVRAWGWIKSNSNVAETDESPRSRDEFAAEFTRILPAVASFGIIDKNNVTELPHPAPLVGVVLVEPKGVFDSELFWATSRKAARLRLAEEGILAAINSVFESDEDLLRMTVTLHQNNRPAASMAKRLGFKREGRMEDAIKVRGEPVATRIYGLTRRKWSEVWSNSLAQPQAASSIS